MCTVSMIMDHYKDKWQPRLPQQPWPYQPLTGDPNITIQLQQPLISAEEVAEFRRLLERAREYDRRNNEPDCELDEKRQVLKRMAEALGIDISFVEKPDDNSVRDAVGPPSDHTDGQRAYETRPRSDLFFGGGEERDR